MKGFAIRLIKLALSDSPKSREQLLRFTKLPERTLRYNLAILKKRGIIGESWSLRDLRRKIFFLKEDKST